jgi:NADH:ubiquinone oxidoreductase subunit 6 (subunit J)
MEFLNFLREEPVMVWFALIAFLVTIVPVASVLWHRRSERNPVDAAKQPVPAIKPTRFGNRTELVIVFVGLMLLLAVIGWIRST